MYIFLLPTIISHYFLVFISLMSNGKKMTAWTVCAWLGVSCVTNKSVLASSASQMRNHIKRKVSVALLALRSRVSVKMISICITHVILHKTVIAIKS